MRTDDLIGRLAADLEPVRPLPSPGWRALRWLALTLAFLGLLVAVEGLRPGIVERLSRIPDLLQWLGSIATGIGAAVAAFHLAVPDRTERWALLPLPGLALWLSGLGVGCLTDWIELGPGGFRLGTSFGCFAFIVASGVPTVAVLLRMLRYARWVRPEQVVVLGVLAAAALSSAALTLFHDLDSTLMILIWHIGTIALMLALARMFGATWFRAR